MYLNRMSFAFSVSSKNDYLTFNSKSKDPKMAYLPNFSDCVITIPFKTGETLTYNTGEHAFQSAKFYLNGYFDYTKTFC